MAIISRICGVFFSHPCISLRVRPDPQAFASQSDLVLTAMKTMMNRKNSIKETESVSKREKLRDGLKGKQGVQVAETCLRHKDTFNGLFKKQTDALMCCPISCGTV